MSMKISNNYNSGWAAYREALKAERERKPVGAKDPEEKCIANTDQVDREIKSLKEKKKQLEQQIQMAAGDEKKIATLEKRLAQVEEELSRKDNDTYRRQHTQVKSRQ